MRSALLSYAFKNMIVVISWNFEVMSAQYVEFIARKHE
jgi:hypothetical protein